MARVRDIEILKPREYAKFRINIVREVGETIITHKQEKYLCSLPTTMAIENCMYDIINGTPTQPVYYRAWCGNI